MRKSKSSYQVFPAIQRLLQLRNNLEIKEIKFFTEDWTQTLQKTVFCNMSSRMAGRLSKSSAFPFFLHQVMADIMHNVKSNYKDRDPTLLTFNNNGAKCTHSHSSDYDKKHNKQTQRWKASLLGFSVINSTKDYQFLKKIPWFYILLTVLPKTFMFNVMKLWWES